MENTTEIIIDQIYFKRGTKSDLLATLRDENKPAAGEPIYEMDTGKLKIGDGIHDYDELEYSTSGLGDYSVIGYRINDKFYKDSTYQKEVDKVDYAFYFDANGTGTYRYETGSSSEEGSFVKAEEKAQLVKLYKTSGYNEDGTMTQKAITEGVNTIKFAVGDEPECLVLNPAWMNE